MANNQTLFEKLKEIFLYSDAPSTKLQELLKQKDMGAFFPELIALKTIQGNPKFHPEGSVFEHSMQTLDAAAEIENNDKEEKFMLMLAALCHDFGKIIRKNLPPKKALQDDGHDRAGVPLTENFLRRLTNNEKLILSVCKLVRYHHVPLIFFLRKPTQEDFKQIAQLLAPEITLKHVLELSWCDIRGTNAHGCKPLSKGAAIKQLLQDNVLLNQVLINIKDLHIEGLPPEPLLLETDLYDLTQSGEKVEDLIREAYQIQIDERITDKVELFRKLMDK